VKHPHSSEGLDERSHTQFLGCDVSFPLAQSSCFDQQEMLGDAVKSAIDALPKDFREPVILSDLEGKSYKEIAEAIDCPLGTVMSRLHRGRKMLRQKLRPYALSKRMLATTEPAS
jgi:RNA polymerase sigma-70 factor (ECF subfamily)